MANWYIRSGAGGSASGADWANAKLTLAAAFTAGAAGDSFFVSEDHSETQATALTLTVPGTIGSAPSFVYSVNHAGSVPPVSADLLVGATISTTSASDIRLNGNTAHLHGLTFKAGDAANTAGMFFGGTNNRTSWNFKSCAFTLNNTSASSTFQFCPVNGGAGMLQLFDTCTFTFGSSTSQTFTQGGSDCEHTILRRCTFAVGASIPTTVFTLIPTYFLLEGCDLSAFGSGVTLFGQTQQVGTTVIVKDCKLGASVTKSVNPNACNQTNLFIRSDSAGTNYLSEKYRFEGTETVETTIVRTGGASDGTTTIAKKIVTTANIKWVLPFEALPIAIWNDSTSSVTVTVYGIWGGGAVPNNDDIWMDVEYLGSALTPQGSFATSTKADNLATASALTTDTSTWGGSTTKFKMTATFTPAQKGAIYIYIKAAAASSTFYIDPKPVLS